MLQQFKVEPYKWQREAIRMSYEKPNLALLAEMGTGKSGAMVNILRGRYTTKGRIMKTLILSPLVTLYNWKNEFRIHSNIKQDKVVVLAGNGSKDKVKKFKESVINTIDHNAIIITNYEALLSETLFKLLIQWGPEVVVCDESQSCKNHTAKRSKAVYSLASRAENRYIMSGTPILNNITDIFMQFKILDDGETFGENFHVFKSKYMYDANATWRARQNYFPDWKARPEKYKELQDKIYTKAIRVTKNECLDLPPLIQQTYPVELSTAQKRYYDQMQKNFLTWVEEGTKKGIAVAQLAITKALRLQQIASGFVTTDDDQTIEIADNPRIDAVKELLQDLHLKHKIILWCSFRPNYTMLAKLCTQLGIKFVFLTGDMNGSEKAEAIETFNTDPTCRVIIANRKAGGIGVNLVSSDVSITFSRNFSLEEELQSSARNHRGGSEIHERILKIDLCASGTIDEVVTEALVNKKDIADKVVEIVKGEV